MLQTYRQTDRQITHADTQLSPDSLQQTALSLFFLFFKQMIWVTEPSAQMKNNKQWK